MDNSYNNIAGRDTGRLIAISDAVFGVAMTLLVLEIKVPEVKGTDKELMMAFLGLLPKFMVYFLSFMTAGIFWMGQSAQFDHIRKSDRNLSWITLLFLLFVAVLPFTTAFLGDYLDHKFALGLYWFNIFLLGLILYINWSYAERKGLVSDTDKQIGTAIKRRIVTAQTLYLLGALLGLINPYWGIGVIIIIQLNYAFAVISNK
ncbi:MAG TPA: DUF1211 domain-containing protein [Chryseobacterium sp.]|uniref:TMEM175 family protein n=1 Tax=Chryseobacterium lactis TaxID=1241981 RepID=UPI000EDE4A3D|nr:TMEM175 family protein [Chryseobacterium lactis]HCN51807.1 DUF1211 domain-containing protein [Chryseobacterium sp.]